MDKLYNLAASITASVGGHGSSVLIFVPGMSDIEAISDLVDRLNVPDVEFVCLPIHSDGESRWSFLRRCEICTASLTVPAFQSLSRSKWPRLSHPVKER